MSRLEVDINPHILKWAREESGFNVSDIAAKLEVSTDHYELWEEKGKKIPFGKLKAISTQFKRQLAVFFLSDIPKKSNKPKDYRNLSNSQSKLSREVLMVMRDVTYFRQTALEMQGQEYWQQKSKPLAGIDNIKNDNNALATWLREHLKISVEEQTSWKSDSEAYRNWRQAIENHLGILVFQFAMPLSEVQGFCFTDFQPYAIVVNSKYKYNNRLFTLFHELGHIFRHHSGICLPDNVREKQEEEYSCNNLAGKFLIPDETLVATDQLSQIQMHSNKLRVSREVYLRRLREEHKISDPKFFSLLKTIRASYRPETKKKTKFGIKPEVLSRASRGETFFNLVLDGVNQNKISYTKASSVLNLKVSKILNAV
ncbi:ImmA/IrrE family metallo-endopeptidase [Sediminibacterium roseum]|uniref:ImmA/IrrE family metallo-endopeptidase n=1 Tax=Sediminibacterium roseum TaxID=1978412 RepID=A0ABW9ZUU9_9BACT|nr:ImmA/IrrE family metallo-endopeptidase [Sediminibacterium roseum]NCI48998.1 ImmA/IrrE family metallo-endopeptidase [Sediminibacterium roseum]